MLPGCACKDPRPTGRPQGRKWEAQACQFVRWPLNNAAGVCEELVVPVVVGMRPVSARDAR